MDCNNCRSCWGRFVACCFRFTCILIAVIRVGCCACVTWVISFFLRVLRVASVFHGLRVGLQLLFVLNVFRKAFDNLLLCVVVFANVLKRFSASLLARWFCVWLNGCWLAD